MAGKPKCRTCDTREVENEGDECERCAKLRADIIAAAEKLKRKGNGKK